MKQFLLPENPEPATASGLSEMRLTGRAFHYLCRVRRYKAGDSIPAMSPGGQHFVLTFQSVRSGECLVSLAARTPDSSADAVHAPATGSTRITLMPALLKGRKMDMCIRQAVEVGAVAVCPMLTEYGQVRFASAQEAGARRMRWERIATEALQQCGGQEATRIDAPAPLEMVLKEWDSQGPLLFLHEQHLSSASESFSQEKRPFFHRYLAHPVQKLAIMTGPEGGFSPAEVECLLQANAAPIYLGNRVLRAETAALYALAAAATLTREIEAWQSAP